MWRFVLKENIRRFRNLAAQSQSQSEREKLELMIGEAQSELAELEQASTPQIARDDDALQSFAERVVAEAMKQHGAQFSTLQIYDENRDHLIILAQSNLRAPFLHHLASMRPGDGSACGRCLADDAAAAIADVNRDAGFVPHREAARDAGFEAVQASPVRDGAGNLIAVLSVYFSAPQSFSAADVERMSEFASSFGPRLEQHLGRKTI